MPDTTRFCALVALAAMATPAFSQTALPPVNIASPARPDPIDATLNSQGITDTSAPVRTSDTASLLSAFPGTSVAAGGGVSGLPALHGLGADRVNVVVDGAQITMACANDMNTPLSYLDPSRIGSVTVIAGIAPVSLGGDSIGGTIVADPPAPRFATNGAIQTTGRATGFYRSNGNVGGGSVAASLMGEDFALAYSGSIVSADDYRGGGADGIVRSTEYESANHALSAAWRHGTDLFTIDLSQQYIPRQGFPNQWMDMVMNRASHAKARWQSLFDWGTLDARIYWQRLRHEMNFLTDKGGSVGGGMPMETRSETFGYAVKATLDLGATDELRIGSDFVHQSLDDWWPAVPGSMMMGPLDYKNITDGRRTRLGLFAEWQRKWDARWTSLVGLRSDTVSSNAGQAQPYSWTGMMSMDDAMAAKAFNAAPHARTDADFDVTALLRYAPDEQAAYEFGYARKSRAPNLYERYAWGRGTMASTMIGWFGDGNGYVGNLDLKPEVAHTISFTGDWHGDGWEVKLSPYYTRVEDYIDVRKLKDFSASKAGFVQLQFVNQEAELYGSDLSASLKTWDSADSGTGELTLTAGWVRGTNLTRGGALYHLMPVHATATLAHRMGAFDSAIELVLASEKSQVDTLRHEPRTGAYALVNLRGGYRWRMFHLEAAVENLFDTGYAQPLGGVSLGDYRATGVLRPLPGKGRSLNLALTAELP